MNLAGWIARHAAFAPGKTAIRFGAQDISYGAFARRTGRAAAGLAALGVGRGDAVAYLGLNHPEMLAMLFACARLGAMLAPLNWRLAVPEHERMIAACPPRVLVVEPAFAEHVRSIRSGLERTLIVALEESPWKNAAASPPQEGAEDSPVLLCHTSGSTGAPKGVVLTQRALLWNAVNSTHMHDLTSADRVLTTLPLFHVGGLNILTTPALHAGASVVLHARFDAQAALEAIERERITLAVLVPAQLSAMMESARWASADLSSLRMITTGSTIVPEAFVRKVNARGVPLVQVYGATETCPIATYVRAEDAERKAGSAGVPALHCEVKVVDDAGDELAAGRDGEILVRGPNVAAQYWNDAHETAQALRDGWYRSGDIGHFDEEGHLYVVSRKKDMIISGGENIYPAELENILAECPTIEEACVVGRADGRWGEAVVAAVVLKPGACMCEADVLALFQGRIARYKQPREVRFLAALPRTELGKLRKEEIRRAVSA
ncbi:MAG: feruloyl-CoA synthetase [Betaproteobacteria bacterium RIFCSPHIGHO2_12_FULL_69_13]|nr:MAG: feruloyl-CoA synthetase [Betaproteobacteria bacterium RIFCSPHIGHO2_12_FULL_69_13]OGA71031.1 MAG: feruloyl-CoA synthetase [Betaproteobacteria bacterium RIFCSPLOWO2_12_FULL_68_20]